MGVGALIGDYANQIALFLVGRSLQGLGAGGLVILTYVTHEDLLGSQASAYLAAIICSVSVGTISGPFVGAVLNESHRWVGRNLNSGGCGTNVGGSTGSFEPTP